MEDGSITDSKIRASSTHSSSQVAWGRLHDSKGSWTPNTDTGFQWLQVNFVPEVKLITHIATQGNGKNWWWVKEYYVEYKKGGDGLKEYKENNHRVVSSNTIIMKVLNGWPGKCCFGKWYAWICYPLKSIKKRFHKLMSVFYASIVLFLQQQKRQTG